MKAPDAFRTISEVAEDLDLPQHVLRFWETRFTQIKPMKRGGGRRYYRPEDIDLLRGIRLLLYGQGFTIRGVQRLLKEKGIGFVAAAGQSGSVQTVTAAEMEAEEDARPRTRPASRAPDIAEEPPLAAADEEAPPAAAPVPQPIPVAAPPRIVRMLGAEQRRGLESALSELLEARRVLAEAS